jgi:hypothetical protein
MTGCRGQGLPAIKPSVDQTGRLEASDRSCRWMEVFVVTRTRNHLAKALAVLPALVLACLAMPSAALADDPPQITITGGSAAHGGWLKGTQTVSVEARDDVGVARIDIEVTGDHPTVRSFEPPSTVVADTLSFSTEYIRDGHHGLQVIAYDTSGQRSPIAGGPPIGCYPSPCPPSNWDGPASRNLWTDNTAPAAPQDLIVDGGTTWRPGNSFKVSWRNPVDAFSPITGAAWSLCPASNAAGDGTNCVSASRGGQPGISQLANLEVPKPGAWRLWLWLMDSAGNHDARYGTQVARLGFDPSAPELTILEQDPQDPVRIRVRARDATSSVARGEVEIRRHGESTWQSMSTELDADGFSAFLDDGELAHGIYEVRARAFDEAGNERSTDRREGGQPATIQLPARVKTRLAVGKVKRMRARRLLVARPQVRYGRSLRLHGRLTTPGAKPVSNAQIDVWEQVKLAGAPWRQIGSLTTSRTGRFTFKAERGPRRVLRFRYAGTKTVRSRASEVELRVRAGMSFRVNRHRVVNGEEVIFRGRLKGAPLPPTSKLVHLQVFSRGHWATFAIARANHVSGLWSHRYRFQATRGRVRYRFRARVPQEDSYPYTTGTSSPVRVTVRGL